MCAAVLRCYRLSVFKCCWDTSTKGEKQTMPSSEGISNRQPQRKGEGGTRSTVDNPSPRDVHSSRAFPITSFSLPFAPVKSYSSFIVQMKLAPLFLLPQPDLRPPRPTECPGALWHSSLTPNDDPCPLDVPNTYRLACPSR